MSKLVCSTQLRWIQKKVNAFEPIRGFDPVPSVETVSVLQQKVTETTDTGGFIKSFWQDIPVVKET